MFLQERHLISIEPKSFSALREFNHNALHLCPQNIVHTNKIIFIINVLPTKNVISIF